VTIRLPFTKCSLWQQTAFCAALLERMLPNYQMFSEAEEFGEYKVLRNQLDLIWQWLDKKNQCKINYTAQLTKLEEQTPNPEHFDSFGVFPALDVCMALMSLLQAMQDQDEESVINVGRLSENSVSFYVELLLAEELLTDEQLAEELANAQDEDAGIDPDLIKNHPLMQWERATQNELFDFIQSAAENKKTCLAAKELVLEEGLSNLGIEIV
jgi:uncharacterized protein YjaG (DUF416 family)